MEERKRLIVAGALILAGAALLLQSLQQTTQTATFVDESGEELGEISYETAATEEERARGLMFREELDENHGMLFVYEEEENRSFWMKNTLILLDIIFLDSNKTVINIEKAYPEPETPHSELRRYKSEEPAQYVVEVNQNFTERNEIGKGDRVEFTLSR